MNFINHFRIILISGRFHNPGILNFLFYTLATIYFIFSRITGIQKIIPFKRAKHNRMDFGLPEFLQELQHKEELNAKAKVGQKTSLINMHNFQASFKFSSKQTNQLMLVHILYKLTDILSKCA